MDHLNKQQIVLVVLLASFVTAITTGIVTVSLTDNTDTGVVNTVNKVVERTVEKVVPTGTTTIIKTENRTVIVGVDEILAKAVEKVTPSVARVYEEGFTGNTFVGIGIIINKEGMVFLDKKSDIAEVMDDSKYKVVYPDGKTFPGEIVKDDSNGQIIINPVATSSAKVPTYTPAVIADSNSLRLAQNTVIVSGESNNVVYSSLLQSLVQNTNASSSVKISGFSVNIDEKKTAIGSIAINLNGEIIGYKAVKEGKELNYFKTINFIKDFISNTDKKI